MREFHACLDGWNKREEIEWNRLRYHIFYTVSPHVKKGTNVWRLIKLPGDKVQEMKEGKTGVKQLTRDELKAWYEKHGKTISERHLDSIYGNSSKK